MTERRRHARGPSHHALDRVSTPVLVVEGEGRIAFCNRAARRLLAEDDGMRMEAGHRLGFADARAQKQFEHWCGGPKQAARVVKVKRPSGKPAYLVRVAPMDSGSGHSGGGAAHGPHPCIVFITDPSAECALDEELLATLYSLTTAEVRLAQAILRGETLTEFSASTGLQPSTARTQLLSVFKKTGTSRQALLVKLLMSLRMEG